MTKNRTNSTRPGRARMLSCLTGASATIIVALAASCSNEQFYESQVAARTSYEASESARRAADAATVAAIDLRRSNDRVATSVDRLTTALSREGLVASPREGETAPSPETVPSNAVGAPAGNEAVPAPNSQQGAPASAPQESAASSEKAIDSPSTEDAPSPSASDGQGTRKDIVGPTPGSEASDKGTEEGGDAGATPGGECPKASCESSCDGKACEKKSAVMANVGQDDSDGRMFALDFAFAGSAFVALVAIWQWIAVSRLRSDTPSDPSDRLVNSAACAAVVSIAAAGVAYFGVRVLQAGPSEHALWDMPWQAMASAWCGLVAVGLLIMWVGTFASFWQRVGDVEPAAMTQADAQRARGRATDMWRLWLSVLVVGTLPAVGLLVEGRFALLLGMLLVLVFALFGGGAVLAGRRDEAVATIRAV